MPWYAWVLVVAFLMALDVLFILMVCRAIAIREQKGK